MTGSLSFFLIGTPPSLNKVGASKNWRAWHRHKKSWQEDVEMWLLAEKMPRGCSFADVRVVLRFPTRRRRDIGNYQAMLEKVAGDALVNGGFIPDDTPEFYSFTSLEFDPEIGREQTTITVNWEKRAESGTTLLEPGISDENLHRIDQAEEG